MTVLVQTYIGDLVEGHLANLFMSDTGEIRKSDIGKIVSGMNSALQRLFTRLPLLEKEVLVIMKSHITKYRLQSKYSLLHGDPDLLDRYIWDPVEKFEDDVVQVIAVYDDEGKKRPLNDYRSIFSVYTPNQSTLDVPVVVEDEPLSVHYQATHPKLVDEESVVSLGSTIIELPFLHLTAHHVLNSIGSQDALQKAMLHSQAYEVAIREIEDKGYFSEPVHEYSRQFHEKGWR